MTTDEAPPDNCLAGFRCPGCGRARVFYVAGHRWEDDGCATSNLHPAAKRTAVCVCGDCDRRGIVREFHTPEDR